jgi:hypothetical protein
LQKSSASAGSPKMGNIRIRKAEFLNQTSLLRPDLERMFFAPRPKIFLQHYRSEADSCTAAKEHHST